MILLFLSVLRPLGAQNTPTDDSTTITRFKPWKYNHLVELSVGVGPHLVISSVAWHKMFDVAWHRRLKLGTGIRIGMTNMFDRFFTTTPIDRPSPTVFDTLSLPFHSMYSVNLTLNADLALTKWMDIGLAVDIVGVSFGESADARYLATGYSQSGSKQTVKPEILNLLAFSHYNKGSLNNSFYLRFWPGMNLFVKTAFTLYHSAEAVQQTLQFGNRYTGYTYMGSISVGWTPFRSQMTKSTKKLHEYIK